MGHGLLRTNQLEVLPLEVVACILPVDQKAEMDDLD